jgi:beta-1,4-mannosyltransferase
MLCGYFDLILIQNPPCLPVIATAKLFQILYGNHLVLDWHNLGFKMYEEKHSPNHILVKLSKTLERLSSRCCHFHCCVSKSLSKWLYDNFNIQAVVLYDRPPKMFRRSGLSLADKHQLFKKLDFHDEKLFPNLIFEAQGTKTGDDNRTIQTAKTGKIKSCRMSSYLICIL